jgi:hypothetical protein
MFDMTQDELIALNPDLINGVEIDVIPSRIPAALADRKNISLCLKITYGSRKRMALLLPFNIATIGDTANTTTLV